MPTTYSWEPMSMGELVMEGNAVETVITTQSAYAKVLGTTTLAQAVDFTMPSNNRLTYTGTKTKMFHIGVTSSFSGAGTNDIIQATIYKNGGVDGNGEYSSGTRIVGSLVERKVGTGGDVGSTALHTMVSLATNDYIELATANISATSNVTFKHVNFFAMEMYTV